MKRKTSRCISRPAFVMHAGAGKFLPTKVREQRTRGSLQEIADAAFQRLQSGSALDVVLFAVAALENEPQFNAGTGGKLQSDGVARLTAAVMDGWTGRFAGLVNIEGIRNPVLLAAQLLDKKDRVLAAQGAQQFAREQCCRLYDPVTEERWSEWKRKSEGRVASVGDIFGTVGAVALDRRGRLAAATSTGGRGMEVIGRVGDSATVAGNYATRKVAVSATGVGEEIVEHALAARIATRVEDGRRFCML